MSFRFAPTVSLLTVDDQLRTLHDLPTTHPGRARLRARIIESQLPLAGRLARRFRGKGEPVEDLVQTARAALVKAVDAFDPGHGTPFVGFAIPNIVGSLKHHFRDFAWTMKVPRSTQELIGDLTAAAEELTHRHARPPTIAELATHLRADQSAVRDAMGAVHAYHLVSLDAPNPRTAHVETGITDEPGFAAVDDHLWLRPAIIGLPPRERRILVMRFFLHMSQAEIGAEIGVSQMQVSRLLAKALKRLHTALSG
ncbi:hypothetical protein Afil01_44720 [Actinorhabdospora filicis]|uniref:RNA polymerase sigma-B factor n=1 Tax=Actinorhabdospora filicis TaxID=1785913 RepID=A0A9W6SPK1_9ACTN|nr:sigma-70 family RNA polymerase sigma factor [Actinorhabdospora filicis]GLZ79665.1 hypothetical protein Afil01_44720 [Actinorhabdospora filicis]